MQARVDVGWRVLVGALAASVALHAVVVAAVRGGRAHAAVVAAPEAAPTTMEDRWTGQTSVVGASEYVDIDPGPQAGAAIEKSVASPAHDAPAAEVAEPVAAAPPPQKAAPPVEPKPAPKPRAEKAKAAPKPEVDPVAAALERSAIARKDEGDGEVKEPPRAASDKTRASRPAPHSKAASGDDGDGDGAKPGTFGSEGSSGVRSLGRAFTRAIPVGAQASPVWASVAPGTTLKGEVTLHVDATGHITRHAFEGRDPAPPALVALAKGTIASIDGGTFALRNAAVAPGVERLKLEVTVSDVGGGARDELEFASFDGRRGEASFTQPGGRHVKVVLTVARIEVLAGE